MSKLFLSILFLLSFFPAAFSQRTNDAGLKKIAFINEALFEDDKTGIKKLNDAYRALYSSDCFPSPCDRKTVEISEKILIEPVINEIRQSLKQIEAQNSVTIIDVYELDKNHLILAYDEKFTITKQFIDYFNDKQKNPAPVLKLVPPTPQIAFINTRLFEDKKDAEERLKIVKTIQTFAAQKGIAFIFDSGKTLPVELEKYPAPDVTKEFISYYNQIKQ
jgi:hypothetical protein